MHRFVVLLVAIACGGSGSQPEVLGSMESAAAVDPNTPPTIPPKYPENPVSQQQTYEAKGLHTYGNPLTIPDGSFREADDVVIRKQGVVETRRGFKPLVRSSGDASERARTFTDFAGQMVAATTANKMYRVTGFQDGATWTAYSGTYTPPREDQRMRFLQMAEALYFTTDAGVYRLDDYTGVPMAAGVPQAVGGSASLTGTSGFLPVDSQVAYRFVWGYRNSHNRIILGAPSGRLAVSNPSTASNSVNVSLTVSIPSWVTEDYFLQVYRSDTSALASVPAGGDMALAYEAYPSSTELTNRSITITDVTPDALKGASLYSSPNSGIPGSDKLQPPVCVDLAEYKERMFCASTIQRQRFYLTLLSADSTSGGMQSGDQLVIGVEDPWTAGATEDPGTRTFQLYTTGTASQNVANTAQSLVRIINATSTAYVAHYLSGEYDSPGQILIEAAELGALEFFPTGVNGGPYWAPAIPWAFYGTQLSRTGATVTATFTQQHNLRVGQQVELQSSPDLVNFPGGIKVIASVPTPTTFTYTEAGATTTAVGQTQWIISTAPVGSDPTDEPNGLAFSEYAEPDAFPLGNYRKVGSSNYRILRIVPLGDTLFIFKQEGIWTLNGYDAETFSIRAFPTPARLMAPDSVVVLGNKIYALTDQGVLQISESGASIISLPITDRLLPYYSNVYNPDWPTNAHKYAFGVAYETEREYHLWLPSSNGTACYDAYVYNYATQTWVHWDVAATAGYVLPGEDVEYLGLDESFGYRYERKDRLASDYQDDTDERIPSLVEWQVRTGGDPSLYKQWQKVTVFNDTEWEPTTLSITLATEITSTYSGGILTTDGLPYVQSYIPEDYSRSQVLYIRASPGTLESQKRLMVYGLSVDFLGSSTTLR
jgi:hypothetical protein